VVKVEPQPVRDMRRDDQEALEEIRRLFARYREAARHARARDRDDWPSTRAGERTRAEDGTRAADAPGTGARRSPPVPGGPR
jgi:hypothetical protein